MNEFLTLGVNSNFTTTFIGTEETAVTNGRGYKVGEIPEANFSDDEIINYFERLMLEREIFLKVHIKLPVGAVIMTSEHVNKLGTLAEVRDGVLLRAGIYSLRLDYSHELNAKDGYLSVYIFLSSQN